MQSKLLVEVYRLFATPFVDIEEEDNRIANSIPLVVSTMGWTKGLGIDLARRLEEFVQPSDIFSFDISPSDSGSEPGAPRLHTLEPFSPAQQFTPSDHRALSILSYFHAIFPKPIHSAPHQQIIASRWSTDFPLCARPPYELTSHLALDRIVLTGAGAEDVVCSELKRVLAGALVALVSGPPPPEGNEGLYTAGSPPPDPASSNCLGLALVRGVSSDGSKLQLLTPVPSEILANARLFLPLLMFLGRARHLHTSWTSSALVLLRRPPPLTPLSPRGIQPTYHVSRSKSLPSPYVRFKYDSYLSASISTLHATSSCALHVLSQPRAVLPTNSPTSGTMRPPPHDRECEFDLTLHPTRNRSQVTPFRRSINDQLPPPAKRDPAFRLGLVRRLSSWYFGPLVGKSGKFFLLLFGLKYLLTVCHIACCFDGL